MADRIEFSPVSAPPPVRTVAAAPRGGTEDSRRCDAARQEARVDARVDAFRAGPGAVPFADYLHAVNLALAAGPRAVDPTHVPDHARPAEPADPVRTDRSLPRLADVAPIQPEPPPPIVIPREVFRRPAPTGLLLDVTI